MGYTAGDVRGRVSGSQFFVGFGCVWQFVGLAILHRFRTLPCTLVLVAAAALTSAGLAVRRKSGILPDIPLPPAERAVRERVFKWANIAQYTAMGLASVSLIAARRPDYILPAVAIIVALHLFPIAKAFRYPPHYATGLLIAGWAIGCILECSRTTVAGFAAFGTGVILFASATVALLISDRAIRAV